MMLSRARALPPAGWASLQAQSSAPKLNGGSQDLKIRVSGCHNGCAQPEAGDIGIYGEGKRMHGKLVPHYQMYFGGNAMAGGALAIKGPSIPSARIETAVERVKSTYWPTARREKASLPGYGV